MLALAGCSLGTEKPKPIPPPFTPTNSQEASTVTRALKVYRQDAKLIRGERRSCSRDIGPGLFAQICGPFLTPLIAQQRTHLRESVGGLRRRVGPRCTGALKRVFAVATVAAGPDLRQASHLCQREYRAARRRG